MNKIFLFTFFSIGTLSAQTTLIAHKSHGGIAATFSLADPGNFGDPPIDWEMRMNLVKLNPLIVTKLNDTAVFISRNDVNSAEVTGDTIFHHPIYSNPNMTTDSMRTYFQDSIVFRNFDKQPVKSNVQSEKSKFKDQPSEKVPDNNPKEKKRKSNLLWLWLIGGGTFGGIVVLSARRRKKTVKYAPTVLFSEIS